MGIFTAVKNFFCEEEEAPKKGKYDPDGMQLVSAEDLFPVRLESDAEFMKGVVSRAKANDEIKKKVQTEFVQEVERQKAALDQPRPAPAPSGTVKPSWQTVSDDL